jgi:glycosyltransferase involved in cell wall biosynthesis
MRRDLFVEDHRDDTGLDGGGPAEQPADFPATGAALSAPLPAATRPSLSIVMPTISWTGSFASCVERCLDLVDAGGDGCDLVVVFDGVAPPPPASLDRPGVTVLETGERGGPARARNLAAEAACGEILFFVDADVELAGGRIDLDPSLRCKHAKTWSLGSMIYTDIVHRARPWTHLIAASHSLPDALNIDWRGRASGICAVGMLVALAAGLVLSAAALPAVGGMALACLIGLFVLNADFYRLCLRKRGARFAVASVALHWLYYVYSSLTFGVVMIQEALLGLVRPVACHARCSEPSSTGESAAAISRSRPIAGR